MLLPPEKDLKSLVASVELKDVRFVEWSAATKIRHASAVPNAQLHAQHGAKLLQRTPKGFIVAAGMTAIVVNSAEPVPEEPPIRMEVILALEYSAEHSADYSDEVLAEFAQFNATFNAWPYWREFVQTSSARMGLPPLMLPVFRVPHAVSPQQGGSKQDGTTMKRRRAARSKSHVR